jgi:CheY-like chemotaxis protein/GAF domain-containing protein
MSKLGEMALKLNQTTSQEDLFVLTAHFIKEVLQVQRASIALITEDRTHVQVIALRTDFDAEDTGAPSPGVDTSAGHILVPIEDSTIGTAISEKRLIATPDIRTSDRPFMKRLASQGLLSTITAPLITSDHVIGTLNVGWSNVGAFTDFEENLLLNIAASVAAILKRQELLNQTQDALETQSTLANRLEILNAMSQELSLVNFEKEAYRTAHSYMSRLIQADRFSSYDFNPATRVIYLSSIQDDGGGFPHGKRVPYENSLLEACRIQNALLNISELTQTSYFESTYLCRMGFRSCLVVPVYVRGKLTGSLNAAHTESGFFKQEAEETMTHIGAFLGATLENIRLMTSLQEAARQAEQANKAKSEFLANMSHESRALLIRSLESWGMTAVTARSQADVSYRFRNGRPCDILLIDIDLTNTDAFALDEALQAMEPGFSLPSILFSTVGVALDSRIKSSIKSLFNARISKPVRQDHLKQTLIDLFRKQSAGPAHSEQNPSEPVLVIDGNLVNRKVAQRLLRVNDIEADVACSGMEALEALEERRYGTLLLAIQMAGMDGPATARAIRSRFGDRSPYLIALAPSDSTPDDRARCLEAGMNDVVTAPLKTDELLAALSRAARSPALLPESICTANQEAA